MNGTKKNLLGCLVTDIQTGESIGWVKNIIFDPDGEQITELLVDTSARRATETPRAQETGESLVGHALVDSNSRYMGEIVDVVVGSATGRLTGLIIERTPGEADYMPVYQGLLWENGHWVLMQEPAPPLRHTMFPEEVEAPPAPDATDDWMIGQPAAVRLTDRQGHLIIDCGQRITATTIEQASRAGVLHRLEAAFPEESSR